MSSILNYSFCHCVKAVYYICDLEIVELGMHETTYANSQFQQHRKGLNGSMQGVPQGNSLTEYCGPYFTDSSVIQNYNSKLFGFSSVTAIQPGSPSPICELG